MGAGRVRGTLAAQVVPEERIRRVVGGGRTGSEPDDPEEPEELEEPEEPEELDEPEESLLDESVGS